MIRINLLGVPKARRGGKRQAAAVSTGEGPSSSLLILIFIAIVGAGMWFSYSYFNRQTAGLEKDLQAATKENIRLADVKKKYEETRLRADQFESRVKLIEKLRADQTGPVTLLQQVADAVSATDAVWLDSMTDDGKNIDFIGMALSTDSVADLMVSLQRTGAFKTVEIKETAQDNTMKELQAFKFELICEKQGQAKPEVKAAENKS